MSQTETHFGKMKIVSKNMSIKHLRMWIEETTEKLEIAREHEEMMEENEYRPTLIGIKEKEEGEGWSYSDNYKYIWHKNVLYKMLEHKSLDDYTDINVTNVDNEGNIDFVYQFYNGGTCFSEVLEEGLNKIKI